MSTKNTKNLSKESNKKRKKSSNTFPGYVFEAEHDSIRSYTLKKNGLKVLYKHIPDSGVVTTNITYLAGAKDENRGETGIAHMLEHMLFKPTTHDIKRKIDSGAMQFERDTGCVLNANTWKDRTTYFFSYPTEHFARALQVEAERMNDVVLSDAEFQPERANVLSEFDMYFGDPKFALSVSMAGAALQSHPYGHETIGYREDIEAYTVEKLERFYRAYYCPKNATLMIVGDIDEKRALKVVKELFGQIENPDTPIQRYNITEPKQEGERRITISRQSNTNILAFGMLHEGFPSPEWHTTMTALSVLAEGPESIIHKALVDTGMAADVSVMIEPTAERNLCIIYVTIAKGTTHRQIEDIVREKLGALTTSDLSSLVRKDIEHQLTEAAYVRANSLSTAMELTEYVAAGQWEAFTRTEETLAAIKPAQVHKEIQRLFAPQNMTIGHFNGTK